MKPTCADCETCVMREETRRGGRHSRKVLFGAEELIVNRAGGFRITRG